MCGRFPVLNHSKRIGSSLSSHLNLSTTHSSHQATIRQLVVEEILVFNESRRDDAVAALAASDDSI
jgi:hypothetical protein